MASFCCPEGCVGTGAIRGYCDICGSLLIEINTVPRENNADNIQNHSSAIVMDGENIVLEGSSEGMLNFFRELIGDEFVDIMSMQAGIREKPINKDFLSAITFFIVFNSSLVSFFIFFPFYYLCKQIKIYLQLFF